jgi:hypothetical protein
MRGVMVELGRDHQCGGDHAVVVIGRQRSGITKWRH